MASASGISGAAVEVGSVTLPTWAGGNGARVPLRAHALLGVVPLVAVVGVLARGGGGAAVALALVATGPGLFGTVVVHEVGHLIAATRRGAQPVEILLWPLGGLAVVADAATDPRGRLAIAAAGPATHVPMALAWLALAAAAGAGGWFGALFRYLFWLNVSMGAFNLCVPCFPLDCSQIACAAMVLRGKGPSETATCLVYLSVPIALGLLAWGLWDLATGGGGVFTVLIALWLGKQTDELRRAEKEDRLDGHPLFRAAAPTATAAVPVASPVHRQTCACGAGFALAAALAGVCVPVVVS